ncbi:MAG TPA: zf-HC2 domain-containing protein, partial [Polyangia bacterium]
MGEPTTNTSGACELVLDYVYGELDEARKRTFEEHLPACARCQQEVASLGRVRTAVKRVMPAVEPTAPLGGALHAQLMHAAAQRKPRRGVLLAFPRKIVEHPALSAAAMFVLVGGAIAINWSRGKLAMPAAEQAEVDTPKPTEAPRPPEVATATPAAEPMPASKAKELERADNAKAENALYKGDAENKPAEDKSQLALAGAKGSEYAVQRPVAHHATGTVATAAPKKAAPARMKNIAADGKMGKYESSLDDALAAKDEAAAGPAGSGGVVGGVVGGGAAGAGRGVMNEGGKSSAPDSLSQTTTAEKAPARDATKGHGYAAAAPAAAQPAPAPSTRSASSEQTWRNTAPAAPPPATTSAPSSTSNGYYLRKQADAAPVQKPAGNARSYDVMRKQAVEYAKTGRCVEAIKLYQELDKASQHLSPGERVPWVRCLTQQNRQEEAQQRLDELK